MNSSTLFDGLSQLQTTVTTQLLDLEDKFLDLQQKVQDKVVEALSPSKPDGCADTDAVRPRPSPLDRLISIVQSPSDTSIDSETAEDMGKRAQRKQEALAEELAGHFVTVDPDGAHFVVRDTTFVVAGGNCPSLVAMAAVPGNRRHVQSMLDAAVAAGLNVMRVFAFMDGPEGMQRAPGDFNEDVYRALDYVVHEARQRHLRLILVLTNYGPEGGGMRTIRRWSCAQQGLPEDDKPEHFYTDPCCQSIFKAALVKLVDRESSITKVTYRDDPTILCWSLANAPRCAGDYSGSKLQEWAEGTAEFLKSLDPNHMITLDVEGFFGGSSAEYVQCNPFDALSLGVDFFRNFTCQHLDFASFQCWPDEWQPAADEDALLRFTQQWVAGHISLCTELHKPVLLTAFGKKPAGSERAAYYRKVFQQVIDAANEGLPIAGALFIAVAVPGWTGYYPEYHVFLDVPKPARGIRSFKSDDEESDAEDETEQEARRAASPVRSTDGDTPARLRSASRLTAADDYETVLEVQNAATALRAMALDSKTDCSIM